MPKKPAKAKAKIINQEYELVPTGRLRPHPRNVNRGDLAVIAESIAQNGFYGAVVAQRSTGYILAGNHRTKPLSPQESPLCLRRG
jgi:ParB-like chromosome segregation protein Spo0J